MTKASNERNQTGEGVSADSQSKRAEESLRESEERFRRAFDDAPIGMALISPEGRYLRVNGSLCDSLGYAAEELIGMAVEKIIHPDDHYTNRAHLEQLLSGKIAYTDTEKRVIHKKGHIVWMLVSISVVRDGSGRPLYLVSQMRDISRQKQAEDAQRESEELFRSAFDDAPIGMALSSPDGHYLRVNRSLCGMLGYSEKELLATTWQAITHPDDLGMNLSYMKQALAGDVHYFEVEKRYVHKGGRIVWALSGVSLVRDERGKPLHFVSQVRDITEQKRLAEEMVRLKQAVDNSGDVIFTTDAEGVITFVNPEFTRLYGYASSEVVGKTTPRILKSGKHTQEEYELLWKTILAKRVAKDEVTNKTKDGGFIVVERFVSPILDDRGNIAGFLAVQRDMTERRRAQEEKAQIEAQLVLAQKMEAIGTLAGGVAHDFNNILTAIQGYTDLALMKVPEDDPLRHNLTEVRKASERAANLTRQLLLFSQRQAVVQKPVDLNRVVTDLLKMLGRIVGEHYKLETNLEADLWTVNADSGQIEQVIMNLVVNARDAMPGGGEISIATENVGADDEFYRQHPHARPGQLVCLSVSDNGVGMEDETLARIFEPFFTTKAPGKGTGLGLAVVHGIVTKHSGWIDVESEPGKGSTFRVFLPAASKEVAEIIEAAPEPKRSPGTGGRILLIEDETTTRELAEKVLTENGYVVFAVDTAKAAQSVFEREGGNFDLVFSDIVLPDGSGLELAELIHAKKPEIRALLTSGYESGADGIATAQAKGYPFLQKPYSLGDVLRMVRTLLNEK
jgi:PAS domain S-box-containing protein